MSAFGLVLLGAINSTVSVYYYLIAVKHAYLLPAEHGPAPIRLTVADRLVCAAFCFLLLFIGVYPAPLYDWAAGAADALFR